jgi:uncharacterized membrane protein (DUF106 family)
MKLGQNKILKSVGQLIFGLMIILIIFYLFLYWQASGYKNYVIYVQVKNEAMFNNTLKSSDPYILDYGRKLKEEVIAIDDDKDNGDGPNLGTLRWYVCGGIDCDEGWESRFIKKN